MNINWKVRFKNKAFWLGFIPAVIILLQTISVLFGVKIPLEGIEDKLINVVEALFAVLALLGIVVDPTTNGLSDGFYGLQYTAPGVVEEVEDEDDYEDYEDEGVE
jgi:phi LC3 family holin